MIRADVMVMQIMRDDVRSNRAFDVTIPRDCLTSLPGRSYIVLSV